MKNKKRVVNRYYCAILYKEDENFKKYFNNIIKNYEEVTYIEHNRDINEETGEIKKPHIHILFKVGENARHLNSIAREIEIKENYLQGCNKKAMLQYLIHLNNAEKTQYSVEEVQGELKNELVKILLKREPEENKYKIIIDNIKQGSINSIKDLIQYGIENQCMTEIKKAQLLLIKAIEENKKNLNKFIVKDNNEHAVERHWIKHK